ncbi:hypothetical protein ACRS6B_12500 [Nocardia asteroides]
MNPLLLIGGAVLALGLLGLVLSMLLRPSGSKAHLTVADLQARLAHEQSAASGPDDAQDGEPAADRSHTADVEPDAARTGEPGDATTGRDGAGARAEQVLLPDHRRRDDQPSDN